MMKQIIEQDFKPIMISLFNRIKKGGLTLEIDATPVYNPKAQFVGGKVINAACYAVLKFIKTEEALRDLRDIVRMASAMDMETWGIMTGISGLYRLQTEGLLEKVVDEETLIHLKKSLDWRTFIDVDNHYALIHKPTNYYGVAFGIARYRELLGWESENHSECLLDRFLEHIRKYSGELSFMDETPGEGRFDRYSILVPSELTALLLNTGMEVPDGIRTMLKKSVHIFLQLANENGSGFAYGRSIGAYGDTAALEVFAAAARLGGILTEEELEIAYGYSIRIMKNLAVFWYDKDMDSINMWEYGRKTDNYRNKNRILGENISICMQVLGAYENWKTAGFDNREICSDYVQKLAELKAYTYVPFAENEYKRGLVIVRDDKQIWSLPLINGGRKYYNKDAYMPVPFQNFVLQGVPECSHYQLVPQIITESEAVYVPLAYTTDIIPQITEKGMIITCKYSNLCCISDDSFPQKAEGFSDVVKYAFGKNYMRREDTITIDAQEKIKEVRLVLLTYSEEPKIQENEVFFGKGVITGMCADGYGSCIVKAVTEDGDYDTPQGRLNNEVTWSCKLEQDCKELKLGWIIHYE